MDNSLKDASKKDYLDAIQVEMKELGIYESQVSNLMFNVFINANPSK